MEKENGAIEGKRKRLIFLARGGFVALCTAMVFYHALYAFIVFTDLKQFLLGHLGLALVVMSSKWLLEAESKKSALIESCYFVASIVVIGYLFVNAEQLQVRGEYFVTSADVVIGIIFLILLLRVTYKQYGFVLPALAILLFVYSLFGFYLPGMLKTTWTSLPILLSQLTTSLGDQGVFGIILSVSALYVFIFLVFGAFIQETGVDKFFEHLGNLVAQKFRSGPALATVVASGLVGSLTGQVGADITVAGSYTVPAMKKLGYKAEELAGILAAAGTAGPIVPPVMGVAAFVMAGITGISYFTIVLVAIIPAALYVVSVGMTVELRARKIGIRASTARPNYKEMFFLMPLFLFSLGTIVFLFITGNSPLIVGFWASVVIVVLSMISRKTRLGWRQFLTAFCRAAELASGIAVTCAILGVIVGVLIITGLAMKLPIFVESLCGSNLILLLFLSGVVSIILGCGVPASASYILVAVVLCPTMIKLGVPLLAAHFFAFYFANFSYITPPVALAAVFAAKLTDANYLKAGVEASKYGLSGFLIPYAFAWCPGLMGDFSSEPFLQVVKICCLILAIFSLQIGVVGYFVVNMSIIERVTALVTCFIFFVYIYSSQIVFLAVGALLALTALIWQARKGKGSHSLIVG
jgi:TRAP transporter 4TM/12TM fusion protein